MPLGLDAVRVVAQAGGIDEFYGQAVDVYLLAKHIARCSGDFSNDGRLLAAQQV